ncbi:MAG: sensor histidine kinase [Kineosporiaceae bacterium]
MSRARLLLSTYGLDALIVVAAVSSGVGTLLRDDTSLPSGAQRWVEAAAITGVVLLLLPRGRFPFGAPAALWLTSTALSFLDGRLVTSQAGVYLAGLGAAVLLGNVRSDVQARAGLAVVVGGGATVVYNDPGHTLGSLVSVLVLFALGWLVGYALRERTERTEAAEERATRAEREREAAARLAVAEERARIARELHDVVAHAVSVMVLQVGAVRHRMRGSDAEDREALENVEKAGRAALTEMRRLLEAMRGDDEPERVPHPGLADLGGLIDRVRAAGLAVGLQVDGEPVDLPAGLDLSVYRIVQEALTNTLRHAGARRAEVALVFGPHDLRVEVRDDGRGPVDGDAGGHGLVGIQERVKIYGGEMSAAGTPGGGFVLWARLPMDGDGP